MKQCIILGAGLIGQQFARLLDAHPFFSLTEIISSKKSEGQSLKEKWRLPSFKVPEKYANLKLTSLDKLDYDSFDIAFSALPSSIAKEYEWKLANKGKAVFSNASAYRYESNIPILIPEINSQHIEVVLHQNSYKNKGFIITNSNCTVSGLAILLHCISQIQQIKNVFMSSYQAISGAGFAGLESIPRDRVIPYIENEENKITIEARKILGTVNKNKIIDNQDINEILAMCARVPVIDGHLEAVTIEFESEIDSNKINEYLSNYQSDLNLPTAPQKPLRLHEEMDRPQSALDLYDENGRSSGMVVNVSPIRFSRKFLRCFLLVHNTIRGGAGGSILNAEFAHSQGYI